MACMLNKEIQFVNTANFIFWQKKTFWTHAWTSVICSLLRDSSKSTQLIRVLSFTIRSSWDIMLHDLGFNDLKLIEVAELLQAHHGQTKCTPDFRDALYVQQVIEAMQTASKTQRWVSVPS